MLNKISIFLFFSILSCKSPNKPRYDNEKLLFDYLKTIQKLKIMPNKTYNIAIIQIGICGACTEFNKTKIKDYFSQLDNMSLKILILSDENKELEQYFLNFFSNNLILYKDNGINISRYGLRYSKDLLIKIKNESVSEFIFLEGK